jgi:hypothetical protein
VLVKFSAPTILIKALVRALKIELLSKALPSIFNNAEKLSEAPAVNVISKRNVPLSYSADPLVAKSVLFFCHYKKYLRLNQRQIIQPLKHQKGWF